MKARFFKIGVTVLTTFLIPLLSYGQTAADDLHRMQGILDTLYSQMIPLSTGMIGVARGIAGFAALWYIAARVWKHLAAAETIDYYPLLRPFALGFCILIFPSVLALMNGIMQPVVDATDQMVSSSNQAIATLLNNEQKSEFSAQPGSSAPAGDGNNWYQYGHQDGSPDGAPKANLAGQISSWGWTSMVKSAIAELLNVLFEAAALCIDTIRTFKLIVLAILGPLCFGLSIFDGFQHTLKQWIARYVNVFMWLPVANIFGAIIAKIQENMIRLQATGGLSGNTFGNENTVYLIFLVIGIVGYFTVPAVAGYIMDVGGHALFNKTSALASMVVSYAATTFINGANRYWGGTTATGSSVSEQGNNFMQGRLSGPPPETKS
jgi:conjugative transposon TraJ protein